jgi:hypothetical protein
MRHILIVTFSTLMLTGCADSYDKSADINECKPVAPANHPVSHALYGTTLSDNNSLGGIPGRDLPIGSGRFFPNDTSEYKCVHNEDNKGSEPQTHDLQKLGATRSFRIGFRPV